MQIEKKNVSQLLPADYNPRKDLKPGDKEYEKLKRSIEQFGYVEPVIWKRHHFSCRWWSSETEGSHRYGHHRSGMRHRRNG